MIEKTVWWAHDVNKVQCGNLFYINALSVRQIIMIVLSPQGTQLKYWIWISSTILLVSTLSSTPCSLMDGQCLGSKVERKWSDVGTYCWFLSVVSLSEMNLLNLLGQQCRNAGLVVVSEAFGCIWSSLADQWQNPFKFK